MNKKSIIMLIAIILIAVLIGVILFTYIQKVNYKVENPTATIKFKGYDEAVVVELYPDQALNTVKNFITLSNNGFYNDLIIHRVEKGFVIQGGDPKGTGEGGPTFSDVNKDIEKDSDEDKEYSIVGEFSANGYDNNIKHERGVISMARSNYSSEVLTEGYNSAGSQFFICVEDSPSLNGQYAAFGKVTSGMDTVDAISNVELAVETDDEGVETQTSKPKEDVVIESITVDTHGVDYGMPEIKEAFDYNAWFMKTYYGYEM